MNAEQRQPYLEVASLVAPLCTFCHFSDYVGGGSSPCMDDGAWCECHHPVDELSWQYRFEEDLPPGSDCWGFRPGFSMEMIADIVGMILAGGWDNWAFTHFPETGNIIVGGWSGDTPPQPPADRRLDVVDYLLDSGSRFGV